MTRCHMLGQRTFSKEDGKILLMLGNNFQVLDDMGKQRNKWVCVDGPQVNPSMSFGSSDLG